MTSIQATWGGAAATQQEPLSCSGKLAVNIFNVVQSLYCNTIPRTLHDSGEYIPATSLKLLHDTRPIYLF
jgi:hypothetical protein